MTNWKAPGPDNVQGYWLKNLTLLHDKLLAHLQDCQDYGVVSDWLTKGRAVLIHWIRARGILLAFIDVLHSCSWYRSYCQVY